MALPQYRLQVRGVPAHACHATLAHELSLPCIQPPLATCTLKKPCCTPHLLVAGIHRALKNFRCCVHASTKLHLLSSLPGAGTRTTQMDTLIMGLKASCRTFALRVSCLPHLPCTKALGAHAVADAAPPSMFALVVSLSTEKNGTQTCMLCVTHCHDRRRHLRLLRPSLAGRRRIQRASGGAWRPTAAVALETSVSLCFLMCETDAPAVSKCTEVM